MQSVQLENGVKKISKKNPQLTFWIENNSIDFPKIEQSRVNRDWMDKTYNKIAYVCAPLASANVHGWEIKLPQDVLVTWNGISEGLDGENSHNVRVVSGEKYDGVRLASNEAGIGQISFMLNVIAETDKDHYIVVSGPPNYLFPDAEPLTALWRSDYYIYQTLMISWKITSANKDILFPKGMPIAFITIYPKNLLESTDVTVRPVTDKMIDNSANYHSNRYDHFEINGIYDFPQFYKKGIASNKDKIFEGQKTIKLKPTKYVLDDKKNNK
jgi:hypothetical protein